MGKVELLGKQKPQLSHLFMGEITRKFTSGREIVRAEIEGSRLSKGQNIRLSVTDEIKRPAV